MVFKSGLLVILKSVKQIFKSLLGFEKYLLLSFVLIFTVSSCDTNVPINGNCNDVSFDSEYLCRNNTLIRRDYTCSMISGKPEPLPESVVVVKNCSDYDTGNYCSDDGNSLSAKGICVSDVDNLNAKCSLSDVVSKDCGHLGCDNETGMCIPSPDNYCFENIAVNKGFSDENCDDKFKGFKINFEKGVGEIYLGATCETIVTDLGDYRAVCNDDVLSVPPKSFDVCSDSGNKLLSYSYSLLDSINSDFVSDYVIGQNSRDDFINAINSGYFNDLFYSKSISDSVDCSLVSYNIVSCQTAGDSDVCLINGNNISCSDIDESVGNCGKIVYGGFCKSVEDASDVCESSNLFLNTPYVDGNSLNSVFGVSCFVDNDGNSVSKNYRYSFLDVVDTDAVSNIDNDAVSVMSNSDLIDFVKLGSLNNIFFDLDYSSKICEAGCDSNGYYCLDDICSGFDDFEKFSCSDNGVLGKYFQRCVEIDGQRVIESELVSVISKPDDSGNFVCSSDFLKVLKKSYSCINDADGNGTYVPVLESDLDVVEQCDIPGMSYCSSENDHTSITPVGGYCHDDGNGAYCLDVTNVEDDFHDDGDIDLTTYCSDDNLAILKNDVTCVYDGLKRVERGNLVDDNFGIDYCGSGENLNKVVYDVCIDPDEFNGDALHNVIVKKTCRVGVNRYCSATEESVAIQEIGGGCDNGSCQDIGYQYIDYSVGKDTSSRCDIGSNGNLEINYTSYLCGLNGLLDERVINLDSWSPSNYCGSEDYSNSVVKDVCVDPLGSDSNAERVTEVVETCALPGKARCSSENTYEKIVQSGGGCNNGSCVDVETLVVDIRSGDLSKYCSYNDDDDQVSVLQDVQYCMETDSGVEVGVSHMNFATVSTKLTCLNNNVVQNKCIDDDVEQGDAYIRLNDIVESCEILPSDTCDSGILKSYSGGGCSSDDNGAECVPVIETITDCSELGKVCGVSEDGTAICEYPKITVNFSEFKHVDSLDNIVVDVYVCNSFDESYDGFKIPVNCNKVIDDALPSFINSYFDSVGFPNNSLIKLVPQSGGVDDDNYGYVVSEPILDNSYYGTILFPTNETKLTESEESDYIVYNMIFDLLNHNIFGHDETNPTHQFNRFKKVPRAFRVVNGSNEDNTPVRNSELNPPYRDYYDTGIDVAFNNAKNILGNVFFDSDFSLVDRDVKESLYLQGFYPFYVSADDFDSNLFDEVSTVDNPIFAMYYYVGNYTSDYFSSIVDDGVISSYSCDAVNNEIVSNSVADTTRALLNYRGKLDLNKYSDGFDSLYIHKDFIFDEVITDVDKNVSRLSLNPWKSSFYRYDGFNYVVLKSGVDER